MQPHGPMEMGAGVRWGESLAQLPTPSAQPLLPGTWPRQCSQRGDPCTFYQQPVAAGCPQHSVAQPGECDSRVQRFSAHSDVVKSTPVAKISTLSFGDWVR